VRGVSGLFRDSRNTVEPEKRRSRSLPRLGESARQRISWPRRSAWHLSCSLRLSTLHAVQQNSDGPVRERVETSSGREKASERAGSSREPGGILRPAHRFFGALRRERAPVAATRCRSLIWSCSLRCLKRNHPYHRVNLGAWIKSGPDNVQKHAKACGMGTVRDLSSWQPQAGWWLGSGYGKHM